MDIYFDNNYGKLYEDIEKGTAEIFEFKSELGVIRNQFIKREIPIQIDNNKYFDIVTPYGYGGPIILKSASETKKELLQQYHKAFSTYCRENNIVSEFIRFHPIINNGKDFNVIYEVENIRKTLGTNIKDYDDPIQAEFSKSCRKTIRQVLNKGVKYRVIENPDNVESFKEVYYSTMDRNNAAEYYYFGDEYFEKCIHLFRENIILVEVTYEEQVIAAGLYFVYDNMIQAHLSGTLNEYLNMSPAYVIKYATTLWAKENGVEYIHYGGGTSNSSEDPLYKFKKKFSQNTEFDFCIAKKVWNKDIYNTLCKIRNVSVGVQYFPAYRKG